MARRRCLCRNGAVAATYLVLRAIYRRHLAGHSFITLSPIELVHEFYLKPSGQREAIPSHVKPISSRMQAFVLRGS